MEKELLEYISIYNYPVIAAGDEYLVLVDTGDNSETSFGYISLNEFEKSYNDKKLLDSTCRSS